MVRSLKQRLLATGVAALAAVSTLPAIAQTPNLNDGTTLKFALVFSRHGVRPPTKTNDNYNPYAFMNFPDWSVPAGNLTVHGAQLMTIMGGYYKQYFTQQGLLTGNDAADATNEYFYADNAERTYATGQALAAGLLPSVTATVHEQATGTDPLFYPVKANLGSPDPALATAAVNGRIGSNPAALTEAYTTQLTELESLLLNQTPPYLTWQPGNIVSVAAMPVTVSAAAAGSGSLVNFNGSIDTASTLAEIFVLEYCEGFDSGKIAFGKLSADQIEEIAKLHTEDFDLLDRTPYLAQAQGSNLLLHIVNTLNQAATGKATTQSLGTPGQKLVMLVGHDNQIASVGGLIRADWSLPSFANDDTPPGGAMVFELRQKTDGSNIVRIYYTAATMDQQHNSTPLTLDTPPGIAPIFLPGGSTAAPYFDIPLDAFNKVTASEINTAFTN